MPMLLPTTLALLASFTVATPNSTKAAPKTVVAVSHVAQVTPAHVKSVQPRATKAMEPLVGRVISNTGEVLSNARVMLFANDGSDPIAMVRSDVAGRYHLDVPAMPATYSLRIIRIGYVPVTLAVVSNGSGWEVPSDIIMTPIASVL